MARPEIEPKTPLGRRLRDVRKKLGYEDREKFAEMLNIGKSALAYYERGERSPDASVLAAYKDVFSIDANWLLTGEGDILEGHDHEPAHGALATKSNAPALADLVLISHYNVAAAAGGGIVPIDEHDEPEGIALARSFLRRLGANPDASVVIFARGESMQPTIPDGSLLLIDRSRTDIEDNAVFVFRVGDGIKVKRARWRVDRRVDLVSDNQMAGFAPETYSFDELSGVVPIGRVMCIMRTP